MPGRNPKPDHPGVYQVRPDKNTSMIAIVGIGLFAWFANNWAENVQSNSTEALAKAEQAQQINERQTEILSSLPGRIDEMMKNAVVPMQQRLEDVRLRTENAYTETAAQRDIAQSKQITDTLRQEINANQSVISTATGRVASLENSISDINRRLEQIYAAVISGKSSTSRPTSSSAGFIYPVLDLYPRDYYEY